MKIEHLCIAFLLGSLWGYVIGLRRGAILWRKPTLRDLAKKHGMDFEATTGQMDALEQEPGA